LPKRGEPGFRTQNTNRAGHVKIFFALNWDSSSRETYISDGGFVCGETSCDARDLEILCNSFPVRSTQIGSHVYFRTEEELMAFVPKE
jgi:hypothetical protein